MIEVRQSLLAAATVVLAASALPPGPAHAATPKQVANLCRSVSQQAADNGGYSPRLLAMDDPSSSVEDSPPVWQNRDRALMGVVVRQERGRYRLRVCTVAARELARKTAKTVRQTGKTVTLGKGDRPQRAAIANNWLTWVETPRRGRFVIRRQTLNGAKRTIRTFRGEARAIAMTRNGSVAISTITGSSQRVWRWTVSGGTTTLLTPRTLNLTRAGEPKNPTGLQLWDPDTFMLTRPEEAERQRIEIRDLTQIKIEPGARPCSIWKGRSSDALDPSTQLIRSTDLVAALTSSNAWSLRGQYSGEDWYYSSPSVTRLEACDAGSGQRVLAAPAGYDTDLYSVDNDGLGTIAIVGDGIFATGGAESGNTGSGASTDVYDAAYIRDPTNPQAWLTSSQHVATPAAAAFVAAGQIWTIDAAGTRALRSIPDSFQGLRLSEVAPPVLSIVSGSGSEQIPLDPLAGSLASFPPYLPVSPTQTTYPDGSKSATNFGVCSDQSARYCPDPLLPPR